MSNSQSLISNLRRDVTEYLRNGDTEFAMMALRMLEKQCRIESDDDSLAFSLEHQAKILRESGDEDHANQLEEELEKIRQRLNKTPESQAKSAADSESVVVGTSGHYLKMSCGSIVDSRSHLEWYVGPDVNVSRQQSISWVESLEECGGGWRMPKISELEGLYRKRGGGGLKGNMDRVFPKIGGSFVWSGEERGSSEVPVFYFEFGTEFTVAHSRVSDCRALAVRAARRP
jgi:hypothetical protein